MVLGKLDSHVQDTRPEHSSIPRTDAQNGRETQKQDLKPQSSQKRKQAEPHTATVPWSPKARETTAETYQPHPSRHKSPCTAKEIIHKMTAALWMGGSTRRPHDRQGVNTQNIQQRLRLNTKKANNPIKKKKQQQQDTQPFFPEDNIQMANGHM